MLGWGVVDLGEPGDHGGVEGVGLFQSAHALGELADGAGVEDGDGQTVLLGEQGEGLALVASGGFHRHQIDLVGVAEIGQLGDAGGGVGEALGRAGAADGGVQRG